MTSLILKKNVRITYLPAAVADLVGSHGFSSTHFNTNLHR
jgi:hypothetical protein